MTLPDSAKLWRIALRTALAYVAIAGLWIVVSDSVVEWLVSDPQWIVRLSIAKGWFFVGLTGVLLYYGLRRQLRRVERAAEARHRAMTELAEQRWRLDSIIHGANVGTWEWNVQTGAVVINERWAAMLGYSLQELEPVSIATWKRLAHPEDLAASDAIVARHFRGETTHYELEMRLRHRDGHWVWVLDRGRLLTRTPDGKPGMMFGTHTDISARKCAEQAVRESEERFRQIAETIHEVFWIYDVAEARVIYMSPAFEVIWGRPADAVLSGKSRWSDAIHPEDAPRVLERLRERQVRGEYDEMYRIVLPSGGVRWIHDRAFPVRDAAGRVHRIVGTAEDITERRRLEEQFRHAQKMQAIGTLAGGIAHDFNNLLGAITGFAEITRMQVQDRPEARENIDDILRAGRRAISLVRQILAFSRRSASERVLMQLRPIVDEAIHLLRSTIPTTIDITTEVRRDTPAVVADPSQVHQVIMNLGTNAWHAMRDRPGRLEVRMDRVAISSEQARLDPRLRPGVFARICVQDTGSGIAPELVDRIFEPFFTTKPPGEGTGLGLSVVHGIMREHEGFVTVESAVGSGSTFCLHFPAAESEESRTVLDAAPAPRGHGERVLFVDDEPALVRLGVGMLEELGYRAEGAVGAQLALAQVRRQPDAYDLVVTDQTMPSMTGVALARAMRDVRPGLPVIVATGHANDIAAERAQEEGIQDLLMKPISLASLGHALHRAFQPRPATSP